MIDIPPGNYTGDEFALLVSEEFARHKAEAEGAAKAVLTSDHKVADSNEPMDYMAAEVAANLFATIFRNLGPEALLEIPSALFRLLKGGDGLFLPITARGRDETTTDADNLPVVLQTSAQFINALAAIRAVQMDEPLFVARH